MWLRTSSLLVFAALAGGCADVGGPPVDASEFRCPRGLARPFSVKTLIRVGRQNGVSLKRDPECDGGPDAVDKASNIVFGDRLQDDDAIDAREGSVFCDLDDQPFAKPPFEVTRTKYPTDQETYFDVGNVHCAIYPSHDRQIARLETALGALARAPVERRSCPRAPGAPVTVARLISAARTHGVRLLPDARCIEPGVVGQASTIVPYEGPAPNDHVWRDQGEVTCLVRREPVRRAGTIRTKALTVGTRLDLLNVTCTIRPYPGPRAAGQVRRLRATLRGLR